MWFPECVCLQVAYHRITEHPCHKRSETLLSISMMNQPHLLTCLLVSVHSCIYPRVAGLCQVYFRFRAVVGVEVALPRTHVE